MSLRKDLKTHGMVLLIFSVVEWGKQRPFLHFLQVCPLHSHEMVILINLFNKQNLFLRKYKIIRKEEYFPKS